jgi:AraC-like DNA-binding protein
MSRRIERAKRLLAQRDLSITQIGLHIGFSETSSFSATFRKVTGVTEDKSTAVGGIAVSAPVLSAGRSRDMAWRGWTSTSRALPASS